MLEKNGMELSYGEKIKRQKYLDKGYSAVV